MRLQRKFRSVSAASRQRGQSLVEVCIASLALVPLAIGLVYVGQYVHIKQTVQQAAREAAWDAAVAPTTYGVHASDSDAEQVRLRTRYFASAGGQIEDDAPSPTAFSDPMLTDYSGQDLLAPAEFTLTVYSNTRSPGVAGKIDHVLGQVTGALPGLFSKIGLNRTGTAFPPDPNGYITARADATTTQASLFAPLNTLNVDLHSQTVLLADAWNADGGGENPGNGKFDRHGAPIERRTVRGAITYLAPSTAFTGGFLGKIMRISGWLDDIPLVRDFFPGLKNFQPGRTAPDVIPYDKLKPYKP